MAVPYIFANTPGGASIPLSELDSDFSYVIGLTYQYQMESLTVTGVNTLSSLSYTPKIGFILLIVNGMTFAPVGTPAPFSVLGTTITWSSALYSINPGDTVVAVYSY